MADATFRYHVAMRARGLPAFGLAILVWLAPVRAVELGEPFFHDIADAASIPYGNVNALAEDRAGFLWIGTPSGLLRFDGYRVQRMGGDPSDADGLGGRFVQKLMVARDGRLWIATDADGLWSFDPDTERGRHYLHSPEIAGSLAHDAVRALAEDRNGGIWVGTRGGIDYLAPGAREFVHYRHAPDATDTLSDDRVDALCVDHQGDLWIGNWRGLQRLRVGTGTFESLPPGSPLNGQRVQTIFEAQDGRLWIGLVDESAVRLHPQTLEYTRLDEAADRTSRGSGVVAITQPSGSEVWIARLGGIDVFDAGTATLVRRYAHDPSQRHGLAGNDMRALLRDRAGQVWVGTYGGGLQRIDPVPRGVRTLRYHPTDDDALSAPSVGSVLARRNGEIWIGTRGKGIDVLDPGRGFVDRLRPESGADGLQNGWIDALAESADGSVWAGSGEGLVRFGPDAGKVRLYRAIAGDASTEANVQVRRLLAARDGAMWIASAAGLARWLPAADRIERVDAAEVPIRANVNALVEADDGRVWVGTALGLYTVAPGAAELRFVAAIEQGQPARTQPNIVGLLMDRHGTLWVDTARGLLRLRRFDGGGAEFDDVSAQLGIGGRPFGANLLEDASGRIWTSIYMFDPASDTLYALTHADAVDIGTPWFRSYAQTADGLLLFGGSAGLLMIDPTRFLPWTYGPPLRVSELKIDGVHHPGPVAQGVELQPGQRGFSVEFAALDFTAPERNDYAYRLAGYDPGWIPTDAAHRVASYSNLAPGGYTLHVRGSNRTGAWSTHELKLDVSVLPAFWQTPWFIALIVLAASGMAFAGVRMRTARSRARARALQALVDTRTAELRSSHRHLQQSTVELERAHGELQSAHERLVDAQQQLVMQEKMAALGTLTAGVAHEINNPTNFVAGAAQNLQVQMQRFRDFLLRLAGDDADADVLAAIDRELAPQHEQLQTILDGAQRIRGIVRDLRQFSRLDEADHKFVQIAEPIQSTVNLVRTRFDRVRFDVDLACNPTIECQPAKLGQLFMNLIVNACEAIEEATQPRIEDGVVSIASNAIPGGVRIVVADNGCGMDEATRARIFEPFFTTKGVGAGTGLGMAIAFGIVKAHGGEIDVESTPRAGTRISVRLPLQRSDQTG